jgi:hypothetical protein
MTDEHGTSNLDKSIAAVTVLADAELLPAVVDFVRRAANHLGLRGLLLHGFLEGKGQLLVEIEIYPHYTSGTKFARNDFPADWGFYPLLNCATQGPGS